MQPSEKIRGLNNDYKLTNRDLSPEHLISTFHSRKAALGDTFVVKQGPAALESILLLCTYYRQNIFLSLN